MLVSSLFLASVLSLACQATPLTHNSPFHESTSIPRGYEFTATADPSTVLNLRLSLIQNDPAGLERAVIAKSTPGNSAYGQHLTQEQVAAYLKPTEETSRVVNTWLAQNGIPANSASPADDWLSFAIPVAQANRLFNADFSVFTHKDSGLTGIRTLSDSLPYELEGAVEFVHPSVSFDFRPRSDLKVTTHGSSSRIRARQESPDRASSCSEAITPSCVLEQYNIPTTAATSGSKNILGVSGFSDQFANQKDLTAFLKKFRTDLETAKFTTQTLDGGSNSQTASKAGTEANLDIQYTVRPC